MEQEPDLTVIIPTYNEQETIDKVIKSLEKIFKDYGIDYELIVVNDGSTDLTNEKLKEFENHKILHIIEHKERRGKGAAFVSALRKSRGKYIAIFDSDMEYNTIDLVRMYLYVRNNALHACIGSRFKGWIYGMSSLHRIGNIILSKLATIIFGTPISDVMSGLKLASRNLLMKFNKWSNGFTFEIDFVWNLIRSNARMSEIPIMYVRRRKGKSKITFIDGVLSALWILKKRLTEG